MTAAWPVGVPHRPKANSYSETPEDNLARFQPEAGPAITRRRSTIATAAITYDLVMDYLDYQIFETWWRETIAEGALEFTLAHPRGGGDGTFVMTAPPTLVEFGRDTLLVSVALRLVP
jgi:hypothetical protein